MPLFTRFHGFVYVSYHHKRKVFTIMKVDSGRYCRGIQGASAVQRSGAFYVLLSEHTLSENISADKIFGGQNFRRTKIFGGQNFRQQARFSSHVRSGLFCSSPALQAPPAGPPKELFALRIIGLIFGVFLEQKLTGPTVIVRGGGQFRKFRFFTRHFNLLPNLRNFKNDFGTL